jgi:hypothetical protein
MENCLGWAGILKNNEVANILGYFFTVYVDYSLILTRDVLG